MSQSAQLLARFPALEKISGWPKPALLGAALLNEPWLTLLIVSAIYLALLPFSMASYARVRQRRAAQAAPASAAVPGSAG